MKQVSRGIDRVEVTADEENLVANAGLILPATLMARLGLEALINQLVNLSGRVGGSQPGRKVLTLVAMLLAGWSHIDHANVLRTGSTGKVLGFRVMAPSTLGTFLRSFTWGHVRQLDKVLGVVLGRAWALGAGPDPDELLVLDLDSTICEVHGYQKQGAAYGYTHVLGYHPLIATRSDTGEVLHSRLRAGSSQRGHARFVTELVARVRRAGHTGPICLRADGGFWSHDLVGKLDELGVDYSITVRLNRRMRRAITGIRDEDWARIIYPASGEAQVADTIYKTRKGRVHRLIVRRVRNDTDQQALWPDWRYHAFITSSETDEVAADLFHREHARVELAIRDLKAEAGAEHMPSGVFCANAAWLACTVLAHNLTRWADSLAGTATPTPSPPAAATGGSSSLSPAGSSTTPANSSCAPPPIGPTTSPGHSQHSERSQPPLTEPRPQRTSTTAADTLTPGADNPPRTRKNPSTTRPTSSNPTPGTTPITSKPRRDRHQNPIGGFRLSIQPDTSEAGVRSRVGYRRGIQPTTPDLQPYGDGKRVGMRVAGRAQAAPATSEGPPFLLDRRPSEPPLRREGTTYPGEGDEDAEVHMADWITETDHETQEQAYSKVQARNATGEGNLRVVGEPRTDPDRAKLAEALLELAHALQF